MIKLQKKVNQSWTPQRELILLVGKSGSGKDYLASAFGFRKVVSRTTRSPRPGEVDGDSHLFVSRQDIAKYPVSHIVAYTEIEGEQYCALKQDLAGKDVYIIDPAGVEYFFKITSGVFHRPVRIVYIQCRWYKRLYRMWKRNGFEKAINRFKDDRITFKNWKRGNSLFHLSYRIWN